MIIIKAEVARFSRFLSVSTRCLSSWRSLTGHSNSSAAAVFKYRLRIHKQSAQCFIFLSLSGGLLVTEEGQHTTGRFDHQTRKIQNNYFQN